MLSGITSWYLAINGVVLRLFADSFHALELAGAFERKLSIQLPERKTQPHMEEYLPVEGQRGTRHTLPSSTIFSP